MFGFPVQRGFNLQTAAGVYNEQVCIFTNPGSPRLQNHMMRNVPQVK